MLTILEPTKLPFKPVIRDMASLLPELQLLPTLTHASLRRYMECQPRKISFILKVLQQRPPHPTSLRIPCLSWQPCLLIFVEKSQFCTKFTHFRLKSCQGATTSPLLLVQTRPTKFMALSLRRK